METYKKLSILAVGFICFTNDLFQSNAIFQVLEPGSDFINELPFCTGFR